MNDPLEGTIVPPELGSSERRDRYSGRRLVGERRSDSDRRSDQRRELLMWVSTDRRSGLERRSGADRRLLEDRRHVSDRRMR